jgi:hypothetical protein
MQHTPGKKSEHIFRNRQLRFDRSTTPTTRKNPATKTPSEAVTCLRYGTGSEHYKCNCCSDSPAPRPCPPLSSLSFPWPAESLEDLFPQCNCSHISAKSKEVLWSSYRHTLFLVGLFPILLDWFDREVVLALTLPFSESDFRHFDIEP